MHARHILIASALFASVFARAGEVEEIQQLIKTRQLPQALARTTQNIATHPNDAQMRFLKGIIQSELNSTEEAIKTFSALASDYPQLSEPYNNLAVLYAKQNQLDKARTALMLAIQTNPNSTTAHENLGDIYLRMATQSYEKSIQLGNQSVVITNKLKQTLKIQGKPMPDFSAPTISH